MHTTMNTPYCYQLCMHKYNNFCQVCVCVCVCVFVGVCLWVYVTDLETLVLYYPRL